MGPAIRNESSVIGSPGVHDKGKKAQKRSCSVATAIKTLKMVKSKLNDRGNGIAIHLLQYFRILQHHRHPLQHADDEQDREDNTGNRTGTRDLQFSIGNQLW